MSDRVLVVEDEPLIRMGLAGTLEDMGYRVKEARNADEAWTILESDGGARLVITDVDMPGSMDGLTLARRIRATWPNLPVLIMSGKIGVNARDLPTLAQFVSKPCEEMRLVGLVEGLLTLATGSNPHLSGSPL